MKLYRDNIIKILKDLNLDFNNYLVITKFKDKLSPPLHNAKYNI